MKITMLKAFICAAFIGLPSVHKIYGNEQTPSETNSEQKAELELKKIIETCLYDRTNTQPFNYFIDELIKFIKSNSSEIKNRLDDTIQDKDAYLNELSEKLESIKYSRNVRQIGMTLYEYVWLLPESLKSMKPYKIVGYLQARLKHS